MTWWAVVLGVLIASAVGVPIALFELRRQTRRARDAEQRAQASQRLAEIGAMTSGLAHEIKNPLSTIGLNAQLLAEAIRDLPVDDLEKGRLIRRIDTLRREADRLRDTLSDFLQYAGQVKVEPAPSDLNTVVEELVDFFLPQAQHRGVALRADLSRHPLPVMLDAAQFKQALLNLMLNATQAMEGEAPGRPKELILRTNPARGPSGPTCEVHVIDTGPGIAPDTLPNIFTPYFTTKSGGSGLGLPTARRLIEAHGGRIDVHTEVGKGTDFTISLPRTE